MDLLDLSAGSATASIRIVFHDPRMTQHLGQRQAVVRFLLEKRPDEVSSLRTEVAWDFEVNVVDTTVSAGWGILEFFERRHAFEKLVAEDTKSPKIDCFVVLFSVDHFRRKIVKCATEGLSTVARGMDTPAEITDFEVAFDAKKEVLGFDIAMNDVFAVKIGEGVCHLGNVLCLRFKKLVKAGISSPIREAEYVELSSHTYTGSDPLLKPPVRQLVHQLVKLASPREFQHQEDPPLIMEVAMQPQDVRMPQIHLNLDLAPQLLFHLVLHEFVLVHAFERNDVSFTWTALGTDHVDSTKLAFAERAAHFEVVQ